MALAHAHARVAALLRSPPAGPYASNVVMLRETNNVGGSNINMPLPLDLQKRMFDVTCKDFTGNARQLAIGTDPACQAGATALFFAPGSIQIMGARSKYVIAIMLHRICALLRECGHAPFILYMSVDNLVARGHVGFQIDLARAHNALPGFATSYAPLVFPGLVCTYQDTVRVVTFVMFKSGSVMALGIQDLRPVNAIYLQLIGMARQFAQNTPTRVRGARRQAEQTRANSDREIAKAISRAVESQLLCNPNMMSSDQLRQQLEQIASSAQPPRPGAKRPAPTGY